MSIEARPVPDYPRYFSTKDGRVFKELKPSTDRKNYTRFSMVDHTGKRRAVQTGRIVLSTFFSRPFKGAEAAHLDGDPSNNCKCNLAWKTHTDNEADKLDHGTAIIGEKSHLAKLTDEQARQALSLYRAGTHNLKELGDMYGVTRQAIWALKEGRSRKNVDLGLT